MSEQEIQSDILDHLNQNGVFAFRINTMGVWDAEKGIYRNPGRFTMKGCSDIIGTNLDGKIVCIEVKTDIGKLSKDQKAFLNKINRCNGIAFCARSVEQVIEELQNTKRRVYV